MTTATANTEGQTPPVETTDELEGRTPTENILGSSEGEEAADAAEVEAAMAAGWKKAGNDTTPAGRVRSKEDDEGEEDITDRVLKNGTEGDDDSAATGDTTGQTTAGQTTQPDDDPDVPGLGMKASQVKAQLGELETLKKTASSLAGRLGHLTQLVNQAGKGKAVTKDALKNVANEFGEEFADALARDLSEAGFGSGATVDTAAVENMVAEKLAEAREADSRKFEEKMVTRAHPDAHDYFARPKLDASGNPVLVKDANGNDVPEWNVGKHHAAFMQFIGTLPADRQQELSTSWDSDVIGRALSEFKEHQKKSANQQDMQQRRMQRAIAPTGQRTGQAMQPAEDPLMQGWKNVRGRSPAGAGASRR